MHNFIVEIPQFPKRKISILDFGAKSDLCFDNQQCIQQAIDVCSQNGGGTVDIPNGYFLTGPIELKSNVNLHLCSNAFLKFTKKKEHYPLFITEYEGEKRIRAKSPISAFDCTNIAITGSGIIDGSGDEWRFIKKFKLTSREWERCLRKSELVFKTKETEIWFPTKTAYDGNFLEEPDLSNPNALEEAGEVWDKFRPVLMSLVRCNKILIEGVTIQNSPAWNIHPLYCHNFTLRNAYVKNKVSAQNGDGLDLESCQNCEISETIFEAGDDGICLKSGKNKEARKIKFPTKNVWIHDCKVYNAHGGFVVGSEMSRGVEDVWVEDCTFCGTDIGVRIKSTIGRGGTVKNIYIKNIFMSDIIGEAILFTMGYDIAYKKVKDCDVLEDVDKADIPKFHDFFIDNVKCNNAKVGVKIEGLKKSLIKNIFISNSHIICEKDCEMTNFSNVKFTDVKFDVRKMKKVKST